MPNPPWQCVTESIAWNLLNLIRLNQVHVVHYKISLNLVSQSTSPSSLWLEIFFHLLLYMLDIPVLLQVVWRAMQEEFIKQYKGMDELIQRCYPGAQISLEFNIDDILEIFSEIAQQH